MKVGGYAGQVLFVDLTREKIEKEPLAEFFRKNTK